MQGCISKDVRGGVRVGFSQKIPKIPNICFATLLLISNYFEGFRGQLNLLLTLQNVLFVRIVYLHDV